MIIWLIDMAVGGHGTLVSSFNASSGTSYNAVVSLASKTGFSAAGGIGWGATLFGMIYCFQVYTGFQWTGYFAGEIRNVRRTATTSILGALLIAAVGYIVGVGLIYKYYGFSFFGDLMNGSAAEGLERARSSRTCRRWSSSCPGRSGCWSSSRPASCSPSSGGRRPGS